MSETIDPSLRVACYGCNTFTHDYIMEKVVTGLYGLSAQNPETETVALCLKECASNG